MSDHEMTVRAVRRSILNTLSLRYILWSFAVFGFLYGSFVLVGRAVLGFERQPMLWGLVGLIAAAVVGLLLAARRLPTIAQVRSLVDRHAMAGGLVMAEQEASIGQWSSRIRRGNTPVIRWQSGRTIGVTLAAAAFVALGFMAPQSVLSSTAPNPLDVSAQAQELADKIELLEEQDILDQADAAEFKEQLEQVRKDASADDPARTWESLDHLADALTDSAREAAERTIAETQSLSDTESLAEGLAENGSETEPSLNNEMASQAMSKLAEMAKEMAEQNKAFQQAMADQGLTPEEISEMAEALAEQLAEQGGQLTPDQLDQLQKLAGAAQAAKANMSEDLKQLLKARMITPEQLAQCESAGMCDGKGLAMFLSECMGEGMGMNESLKLWNWKTAMGQKPGRGGTSRGRADAQITWKDPSNSNGTAYDALTLPQASLEAMRDSAMVGVSLGAPQLAEGGPDNSNALTNSSAGGGSANRQVVLPRHKAAVSRYFDR